MAAAVAACALSACGSGKSAGCVGSLCDDTGGQPPVVATGCKRDSDCGDGICKTDGTCTDRYTPVRQPDACNPNPCSAGFFCSNGTCLPEQSSCKPADPTCIFIPHGSFEPPVHAWWWPWLTPDGPDDKTGKAGFRADLDYVDYVQAMMTPVVIRLHAKDASPAVVFNTFDKNNGNDGTVENQGVMRAVSGVDGSPIWSAPADFVHNQQSSVNANSSIAAGDCKGDGEVCFITGGWDPTDVNFCTPGTGTRTCRYSSGATPTTCTLDTECTQSLDHRHGGLVAFGSDGRLLWTNRDMQVYWGAPAIARLLGPKGPAQIVVGNGVVDGATGKTLCFQTTKPNDQVGGNGDGTLSTIADIDLDGQPEILTGNNAYKLTANDTSPTGYVCRALFGNGVKVTTPGKNCTGGAGVNCADGFPAVANFAGYGAAMGLKTNDPHPQIVVVSHGSLRIHDWTGGMLLDPIDLPSDPTCAGEANQGGAPTIADFDGDGLPEIGIAGQGGYLVWKPGAGFLWRSQTRDCSSNTGSSVFDFEGKGQANVVYGDQCYTRIYDGKTGAVLVAEKNSSCTAYEMPVVADIDGSGRAKIIVPANTACNYTCDWGSQYASQIVGVKALASPSDKWVNTRSVWNQHAYHVTNVNIDGTLPYPEPNSWDPTQSNSFRQNVQGKGVFAAPDLAVCDVNADLTNCHSGTALATVTVYNGGALVAKAGASVHIYADGPNGPKLVASTKTSTALQPGALEKVKVTLPAPSPSAPLKLRAVVDEENVVGDCHPDNNTAVSATLTCPTIG